MKKYYYFKLSCTHEGCGEVGIFSYPTRKKYAEARQRNKTWTCVRHSNPDSVLGITNLTTTALIKCVKKDYKYESCNFWQDEADFGTDKLNSGFQYGNGYRAFAKDFPEGTIIKITAEVILPNNNLTPQ